MHCCFTFIASRLHKISGFEVFETNNLLKMQVKKEIEQCYELIHRLGRGVVYLGSSRIGPGHPHYIKTFELGNKVSQLSQSLGEVIEKER